MFNAIDYWIECLNYSFSKRKPEIKLPFLIFLPNVPPWTNIIDFFIQFLEEFSSLYVSGWKLCTTRHHYYRKYRKFYERKLSVLEESYHLLKNTILRLIFYRISPRKQALGAINICIRWMSIIAHCSHLK